MPKKVDAAIAVRIPELTAGGHPRKGCLNVHRDRRSGDVVKVVSCTLLLRGPGDLRSDRMTCRVNTVNQKWIQVRNGFKNERLRSRFRSR